MRRLPWLAGLLVACSTSSPPHDATIDHVLAIDLGPQPPPGEAGCLPVVPPAGFHVAPGGRSDGDGSAAHPWNLATALAMTSVVHPGDTVWLHGGTYAGGFVSRLAGTAPAPVTVRSYPGEWAVLDGASSPDTTLQVYRSYGIYRDFEIRNSSPDRAVPRESALWLEGTGIKLVNLVIHDTGNVPMYEEAPDLEVYGCLVFNVGYDAADRAHGHNLYVQNRTGSKLLADNIIFNGYSFGVHAYAEAGSSLAGLRFVGNIFFGAGVAATGTDTLKDNLLVGGTAEAADDILLQENLGWAATPGTRSVRLGYGVPNGAVALLDNYLVGQVQLATPWASVTLRGNTFYGRPSGMVDLARHPDNTYLDTAPTAPRVFIRPNRYQSGRAHVAVYNWGGATEVEVDVSGVLVPGTPYEVRNAQDFFGPPVLRGTYGGRPLRLPMTGLAVAQPIGSPSAIAPSETTGSAFQAFVLLPQGCGP